MFERLMGSISQTFSDIMPHEFCVPCFLKSAAESIGIGLLTVAALAIIATLSAPLAIAIGIGLAIVGVIGIVRTVANWDKMSDQQKSSALGQLAGAVVTAGVAKPFAGAVRGAIGPGEAGGGLPVESTVPQGEGPPASAPKGRLGSPMEVPRGTNADATIQGRDYGGHSIDQMQGRGVPPSAVENTINQGVASPDPIPGRIRYYEPVNNLTVITESNGKVVTVITGKR